MTPDITKAEVARHGVLAVTIAGGVRGEVAVIDRMPRVRRARLRVFAKVEVDAEAELTWPGAADLAPDMHLERVRTGAWPL